MATRPRPFIPVELVRTYLISATWLTGQRWKQFLPANWKGMNYPFSFFFFFFVFILCWSFPPFHPRCGVKIQINVSQEMFCSCGGVERQRVVRSTMTNRCAKTKKKKVLDTDLLVCGDTFWRLIYSVPTEKSAWPGSSTRELYMVPLWRVWTIIQYVLPLMWPYEKNTAVRCSKSSTVCWANITGSHISEEGHCVLRQKGQREKNFSQMYNMVSCIRLMRLCIKCPFLEQIRVTYMDLVSQWDLKGWQDGSIYK